MRRNELRQRRLAEQDMLLARMRGLERADVFGGALGKVAAVIVCSRAAQRIARDGLTLPTGRPIARVARSRTPERHGAAGVPVGHRPAFGFASARVTAS